MNDVRAWREIQVEDREIAGDCEQLQRVRGEEDDDQLQRRGGRAAG